MTGWVSVVDITSDDGTLYRAMRCDMSVLGGIFPEYENASIFSAFYNMESIRLFKEFSSDQKLYGLQL